MIVQLSANNTEPEIFFNNDTIYRQLIQNLQTPLYTTDTQGRITLFNKAAADLWGREPGIGKEYWCGSFKIYRPDGSELSLSESPMAVGLKEQRAVEGEEILIARPDGTLRNVAVHSQILYDDQGGMVGAVNSLLDITSIKQTEQALHDNERKYRELSLALEKQIDEKTRTLKIRNEELKKSEERYHKMIEEVEDYAIILMDHRGIIQNWNKGAEKIKGYKDEEIVGKSFELFYREEDRMEGLPMKLIGEARLHGKAIAEGWRLRKDGTKFWGSIVITALHNDEGEIIGFSKVTRDLTARKIAEDQLREYSNELEFQNKELEQFVYAASHDMKEPLRKIHLYNSFISDSAANQLDDKSKEYLKRSVTSAKRMTSLIEDLLTYSKTTSNIDSISTVDLNAVVEDVLSSHKDELEQYNINVLCGQLPVLKAVQFQCKQLFDNLINNSIKYRHPGRDTVIELNSKIVLGSEISGEKAEPNRRYHKITVKDNGVGFEPEYSKKIFKIFQRLNNAPDSKGSGIGLAICKKIVQNHKGAIVATGKLGQGASFSIYFPVS